MSTVSREDARLLRVLAILVEALPPEKRAAHLAPRCREFAARIEAMTVPDVERRDPLNVENET